MKKFTDIDNTDLLRNKINSNLQLYLTIKCGFCEKTDNYHCQNQVNDKEEEWLATESFIQKGWDIIKTVEKFDIACPECVIKWKSGNWYS